MRRQKTRNKKWAKRREERSMHKKFMKSLMLLMVMSLILTPFVNAEDRVAEATKDMGRGVSSLPREIANTTNDSNIINGLVIGTARGVVGTLKGVGEGVFKLLTFYRQDAYDKGVS